MRNARDIRVVRTQTALLEALEELIKKKKLSCITITDLCAQAKINRNTFFRILRRPQADRHRRYDQGT